MALPLDHNERMQRTLLSLDGLSVGDAFGQRFFYAPSVESLIAERAMPATPWHYTDDTEMALAIVEVLQRNGNIDSDELASLFARRYQANPDRGYGGTAHGILQAIGNDGDWRHVAAHVFGGTGSMGNGGAMRVAPLGAYFADDPAMLIAQARASAELTHAHPEGQAGAIAIALAAAWAWCHRETLSDSSGVEMIEYVLEHTPHGETRVGIERALSLSSEMSVQSAVGLLGNGSQVIAPDTVPFSLWCAARHLDDYVEAMWSTVSGLGDRDTTCAIVGGIVALSSGHSSIPDDWLVAREELPSLTSE